MVNHKEGAPSCGEMQQMGWRAPCMLAASPLEVKGKCAFHHSSGDRQLSVTYFSGLIQCSWLQTVQT